MKLHMFQRTRDRKLQRGFSLLELIIATAILALLSTMVIPLARLTIKREKERRLRADLWEMRDAIDRYQNVARAYSGAVRAAVGCDRRCGDAFGLRGPKHPVLESMRCRADCNVERAKAQEHPDEREERPASEWRPLRAAVLAVHAIRV